MMMEQSVRNNFFAFRNFIFQSLSEIFANESDEEEPENDHMDDYDEEDISEDIDESEEMDEEGGESEISSDEDDENLIHTNGMKKNHSHLGVHQSNVDLLGIDGRPSDSYLQTMNDNLHKKFRRPNHQYASLDPTDREFLHTNNNPAYHAGQQNGDYKNNINYSMIGNGQAVSTKEAGDDDDDDDDDDIVLVSDDDSGEKKTETKINSKLICIGNNEWYEFLLDLFLPEPMTYAPDLVTSYVETVTTKTTTLIFNDCWIC